MNKRNLSFGSNYGAGPAPVNVPPPQPLSFSSIGQFSGSSPAGRNPSMAMPTGNPGSGGMPGMSGIPTTAGQVGVSTLGSTMDQFGSQGALFGDNGNPAMAPASQAPGGGMFGDFFGADGFNMGDLGEITKMIGGFGNLYMGMQQNKLAKESLSAQKDAYQSNLANQIASFNLALEDRMRSRAAQKNRSPEEAQANIDRHKL